MYRYALVNPNIENVPETFRSVLENFTGRTYVSFNDAKQKDVRDNLSAILRMAKLSDIQLTIHLQKIEVKRMYTSH